MNEQLSQTISWLERLEHGMTKSGTLNIRWESLNIYCPRKNRVFRAEQNQINGKVLPGGLTLRRDAPVG
jgi:hypothetical protein